MNTVRQPSPVGFTAPHGWQIVEIRFHEDGTVEVVLQPKELVS